MQTINLKQYYPFCKEDIFVEVSDEIVEAFLLDKRAEAARDRKMFRYKAFYCLKLESNQCDQLMNYRKCDRRG
ncbi:hypothetical protein K190097F3_46470 [Enterocloster clostridioformis]